MLWFGVMDLTNEYRPLVLKADGQQIAAELRIRVRGTANMTLLPDLFLIDIYNISNEERATLDLASTLSAEDEQNACLCYGEIEDVYSHPEETNTITTVVLVDGKKFWDQKIFRTVGGGSGVHETLTEILDDGIMGFYAAENPRLFRGQTFSGKLPEAVNMLAKTVNARAFFTHGAVFVAQKGQAENIVTIDESEVLEDPSYAEGVVILKVKVHGYTVGTIMKWDGHPYRLASQTINADNQKGSWKTELTLVDEGSLSAYGLEGGL